MGKVKVDFERVFRPVSHTNALPLYRQVVHQIEDALRRGSIQPGDYLPPEPDLCDGFGVARSTLRRAVSHLVDRGILTRMQGRGTQVIRQPQMDFSAATSISLFADMRAAERHPRTQILGLEPVTADHGLSERTAFPIGTSLVELRRLRFAGDAPIALMGNHLLAEVADFKAVDLVDESLDTVMRSHGHNTRTVEYEVTAAIANAEHAGPLRIDIGVPLLCERRWAYTAGDTYINFSENYYHPELYHFRGVLTDG